MKKAYNKDDGMFGRSSVSGDALPKLPPMLDEFCVALRNEIEAAKRNASNSALPLSNGHKVGDQGGAFQYAFQIDSVLNTPDGAPGDLIVPGKAPMAATIVSVEGLRLVVSVEANLGKFVPTAHLKTNLTMLMRKLIQRIEENASAQNPAAERMLGSAMVNGVPSILHEETCLSGNQVSALESALGRDLTYIWGPPGTGKTRTIGTIAEHLHKASRSVLIVSHTNTAVDQAIKHVAKSMKSQLLNGVVLRIGETKDAVLLSDYPDVLLKVQVEHHSRALVQERRSLAEQMQSLSDELRNVQETIEGIQWLSIAAAEMTAIQSAFNDAEMFRQREQELASNLSELEGQYESVLILHKQLAKILYLRKQQLEKLDEQNAMQGKYKTASGKYQLLMDVIHDQESRIAKAKSIDSLRHERGKYPPSPEQRMIVQQMVEKCAEAKDRYISLQRKYLDETSLYKETQRVGSIVRTIRRLPQPDKQERIVSELSKQMAVLDAEKTAVQIAHEVAAAKLSHILELDREINQNSSIGTYQQEVKQKARYDQQLVKLSSEMKLLNESITAIKTQIQHIENEERQLSQCINGVVKDEYIVVCSWLQKYRELQETIKSVQERGAELHQTVSCAVLRLLESVADLGFYEEIPSATQDALTVIKKVYSILNARYASIEVASLAGKNESLRDEMRVLGENIADIDAKLAVVEREVINKAAVVGATLTKTYLSDDIRSRRFDTVILDEASMAPIPALWTAALLAAQNLIIVGDFKQLPPIVLSNSELAKKWLGRDIFEVSGIKEKWENKDDPAYFITLNEQRRMLPQIADVANQFYGDLKNAVSEPAGMKEFSEWYSKDIPFDSPVVLIDTGSLHAWVTSVIKNGNSSRLNYLSATVAVDLAEQLVSENRPMRSEGSAKRILIVSPYRAHAKLVSVLLRDLSHLRDDVVAGTAHSFQGSEADVVIFDLVADEPHFRVNLFMPQLDEELKCLLNVALTRARFRLFIIGDFKYCLKQGKKAFLGRELLPYLLRKYPSVDAQNVVPNGLAARAAKAQMTVLGGKIDPDSERIVVTQVDFYRLLANDLSTAVNRIVIYSPFITSERLAFIMPQLNAATERGVQIFIITKSLSERSVTEQARIRATEKHLAEVGIVVVHKMHMHEKLVFVDDDITWSGSLNPLSFSNTQEIMERRKSRDVLEDYFRILRLQDLLAVQGSAESKCPICGAEIIAAEGADQPFYWRCANDACYTRGIDQPYPFDGVLRCASCNAPVEYGSWGDEPHWRCTANKSHRMKVFKSHLRLPKMSALVPKSERKKLCALFSIDNIDDLTFGKLSGSKGAEQIDLFDLQK